MQIKMRTHRKYDGRGQAAGVGAGAGAGAGGCQEAHMHKKLPLIAGAQLYIHIRHKINCMKIGKSHEKLP